MTGRNRRNTADYFSHDADASSDEKIIYLESKFGLIGYALYFKLLETMTRADNFELHWDEIKISIYSSKFGVSVTEIELFVTECCRKEIKAFILEGQRLYSPGLKSRMQPLLEKREYNRKKYTEKINNKTNYLPISVTETPLKVTETTQSKGKESKGKESKKNVKTFLSDSTEYGLANLLYTEILKNNPNHKKPDLQEWAKNISLMIRRDNRNPDDIRKMIFWVQEDNFWRKNVLSTGKLRKKFDRLTMSMLKTDKPKKVFPNYDNCL